MTSLTRTTFLRITSALVALPIYFYTIIDNNFWGLPLLLASIFITVTCLFEFYKISSKDGEISFLNQLGLFLAVIINLVIYYLAFGDKIYHQINFGFKPSYQLIGALIVFLIIFLAVIKIWQNSIADSLDSLAITTFGLVFIVFFFSHIILLKSFEHGAYYILMINILVMVNDSAAYFGGMFFGKHKINSPISPNKTWEGYFTGVIFGIISLMISNRLLAIFIGEKLFTLSEVVFLGLVLCFLSNIGDLVESLIKRDSEIKDSGTIIPGHGGMWDVFDALIFVIPVFYYYLVFKGVQ